ncbi:MAG: hypothetical protein EHM84_07060 [Lysobacterales bacterium]|nr:MAG: hypothetical protein EHM84_07060 [Xanthomonadales bacterium]
MATGPVSLLERELSVSLPEQYKSALLTYPFAAGSVGEEMLVSDVEWLLKRNRTSNRAFAPGRKDKQSLPSLSQGLLLIGIDGGELEYYLKVNSGTNAVLEYCLETQQLSEFAASFEQYLERIRRIDSEIDSEEALGEGRARAIPAWRHSLHFYMPAAIALLCVLVVIPLIAFGIRSLHRWIVE